MGSILDITADTLQAWSQQYEAPGVFPDLVRRLLLATAPVSTLSMNAHGGTRLAGWDGIVRSSVGTPFCPAGLSLWELTVQGDIRKLGDDYRKRSAGDLEFDRGAATYVAAVARRLPSKLVWASKRGAEGVWKDVRAVDAEDIATWLVQAPAVRRRLATRLGRPDADRDDLQSRVDMWRARTRPPLPAEILLAGRERQQLAEHVRAWARGAGASTAPLRVLGGTWAEATAFAAAALALDATPEGEQVRARTVVAAQRRSAAMGSLRPPTRRRPWLQRLS